MKRDAHVLASESDGDLVRRAARGTDVIEALVDFNGQVVAIVLPPPVKVFVRKPLFEICLIQNVPKGPR